MDLEIGNAYSFEVSEKTFGGLFIEDIYKEYRGDINLSIVFIDFISERKLTIGDFINSHVMQLKRRTIFENHENPIEIKGYNIWETVFKNIDELCLIGKIKLKEFNTISSPISMGNTLGHIKNEFSKFYNDCYLSKKGDKEEYKIIPLSDLIKRSH